MNVFTKHLIEKGHVIELFDIDVDKSRVVAEKLGCSFKENLKDVVVGNDFLILCTPIKETPSVIRDIGPHITQGMTVCEIASLKMGTVTALRSLEHCCALSLHPMFGPDVPSFEGQTMAVIPVKDPEKECEFAKQLFPETKMIQVSAESHDKMMAYVLSLPYFMNLVFAHSLTPSERDLMETLSGTTFKAQTIVTDCIVGESSELVESLINGNTYSWEVINQFIDEARYLRRVFKRGDDTVDGYCRTLREQVEEEILLNARRLRGKMVDHEGLSHLAELFR